MEKIRNAEKMNTNPSCETAFSASEVQADNFAAFAPEKKKPSLLLHSCCGPCSTAVIERLVPDYRITIFYYNPCITEIGEYELRKETQKAFIKAFNEKDNAYEPIDFLEGDYTPEEYLDKVRGLENEPEGGARCKVCFRQRLHETAKRSKELEFDFFTTTLTVSPHKNYQVISSIANEVAEEVGASYLDIDFKKKAGFQRSVQLAREYELYRQDYCGCRFSKRD